MVAELCGRMRCVFQARCFHLVRGSRLRRPDNKKSFAQRNALRGVIKGQHSRGTEAQGSKRMDAATGANRLH